MRKRLNDAGISTMDSTTAVLPVIAGSDDAAYDYATACRKAGVIGLPVVTPAVPNDLARLRIAVTARHTAADIDFAADAFLTAAAQTGLI
ncbi:aminotransferase class I/II-fold pyridoxal phosphate-dependent enzyme [Kitasatospora sp. Ki12]